MNVSQFTNLDYENLKIRLIDLKDFGDNTWHEWEDVIYDDCLNYIKKHYSNFLSRIMNEEPNGSDLEYMAHFIYFLNE